MVEGVFEGIVGDVRVPDASSVTNVTLRLSSTTMNLVYSRWK